MVILLCPGIHPVGETNDFLSGLQRADQISHQDIVWVFPAHEQPAYSAFHVFKFLVNCTQTLQQTVYCDPSDWVHRVPPLSLISFSAGVVGALGAALAWHALGGSIHAFVAIDGWGVPLFTPFPTYRVSHDAFTHQSSHLMGGGQTGFWAKPAVVHRQLWRSPHTTVGIIEYSPKNWGARPSQTTATAAQFIGECLRNSE